MSLNDTLEAKKLSKKEIVDFTDDLERVLLHAYNASQIDEHPQANDQAMTDGLSEEQKA